MERVEITSSVASAPPVPMKVIGRTIRDFVLWSYERGTIQYDVMVTLILLFIFLAPYRINFKDKPVQHNPNAAGVTINADGKGGFIYQIEASDVSGNDDVAVRSELLKIIEPISGEVNITKVEPVLDRSGRLVTYRVWVQKE